MTSRDGRKEKSVVRGRHENINSRLKNFDVLNIPFRHMNPRKKVLMKHGKCFFAVAVLTQLKFESGEVLYGVSHGVGYS